MGLEDVENIRSEEMQLIQVSSLWQLATLCRNLAPFTATRCCRSRTGARNTAVCLFSLLN